MKKTLGFRLCVLGCLSVAGISATTNEPATHVASTEQEGTRFNGVKFNRMALNGLSFNALSMNGLSFNALSMNGLHLNGIVLNALSMNGLSYNGLSYNGSTLQGIALNGLSDNGVALNGIALNGIAFNGCEGARLTHANLTTADLGLEDPQVDGQLIVAVELDGLFASEIELDETSLVAEFESPTGETLIRSGTELAGTRLLVAATTTGPGGEAVALGYLILSIDEVYPDPADPEGPVLFYEVSVLADDDQTHTPACEQDSPLIPIPGSWDLSSGDQVGGDQFVTLACRGGALAKCTEWGYWPWTRALRCEADSCRTVDLAEAHQACTRMVRADYCGDGTPHTQNGTAIDVFDDLSPAINVSETDWGVEAEWGPDGAVCLGERFRYELVTDEVPSCFANLEHTPNCGELEGRDGFVANRYE